MMQAEIPEIIKKICFDIFEQLAFMFGEELDKEDVECFDIDFFKAFMSFTGHKSGSVEIIIPSRLAPALAVNILGKDENDTMEQGIAEDALKELLNTLCGRMLPALFTDQETFDLHPPEVESISRSRWQKYLDDDHTIAFSIEESPILLRIRIED